MRLHKLVLHGFKSFADRTEFLFDQPITCIVGPNGCGKSNVVDAFKWVLGEQSAKSLRGGAMLDVIFNGTDSRSPAGFAEVTLVFENPATPDGFRRLALDSDTVSVGRKLFRDGHSDYTLNGASSRLKDIREMFLDTGVGVDAYSVIEQGRVARLLEANPQERRLIFEEAAGISRFKLRRKEASRRLEKVEENLARVADIVQEVDRRLRSVKLAAGKARSYQELSARLAELRLNFALSEYRTLSTRQSQQGTEQASLRFELDDATTEASRAQAEMETQHSSSSQKSASRGHAQQAMLEAKSQNQQSRQQADYAQQQAMQYADQSAAAIAEGERTRNRLSEAQQHAASEREKRDTLREQVSTHATQIERQQSEYRDQQLRSNAMLSQIEQLKQAGLTLLRRLGSAESRSGAIVIEQRNAGEQRQRLESRGDVLSHDEAEIAARRAALQEKSAALKASKASRDAELITARERAQSLDGETRAITQQLGQSREHRSGLMSRQKLLQDLEARREGVSVGVQAVLKNRESQFPFIRGLVADVIRVDVAHAALIEAALNGRDQWLIADRSADLPPHREAFARLAGRVNVIRLEADDAREECDAGEIGLPCAASHIEADASAAPLVRLLLGRTLIASSLSHALELQSQHGGQWRYVTPANEVLEADGTYRAGPLTAAMGLLSRRSELTALADQLVEEDKRIAGLQQQIQSNSDQTRQIAAEQETIRQAAYADGTALVEVSGQLQQCADRLAAIDRERPSIARELERYSETLAKLEAESATLATSISDVQEQQKQTQAKVDAFASEQTAMQESLRSAAESLTSARVTRGQAEQQLFSAEQASQRLDAQQKELAEQLQRLEANVVSYGQRITRAQDDRQAAQRIEQQSRLAMAEHAETVTRLETELAAMSQGLQQLKTAAESLQARRATLEQTLHKLELDAGETRVRLEALLARTQEELQIDLPARYAELAAGEAPQQDWDAVAVEIRELKDRIGRLGNVNLDAVQEQEELEVRAHDLASQIGDLTQSKSQLTELIDTLNAESSVRFEETFKLVRDNFQQMFRKLFGGGRADVVLETELEDQASHVVAEAESGEQKLPVMRRTPGQSSLDAGIEIIARPPGKKPVSISQLSGGEKAMTCIALLMSIFKSKPSPFCILDEVDAPLDEANNQRFGEIVQDFLSVSQFIIITHHKRTMQIGDVLYGVTMQEQGVSTRVAVNFDQSRNDKTIEELVEA